MQMIPNTQCPKEPGARRPSPFGAGVSAMAKGQNVHVVPHGDGWQVKPEGSPAVSNHRTQGAAEKSAKPIARQNESEVVIHRPNGQIRDKDSFGNDPNPPTDTKH